MSPWFVHDIELAAPGDSAGRLGVCKKPERDFQQGYLLSILLVLAGRSVQVGVFRRVIMIRSRWVV